MAATGATREGDLERHKRVLACLAVGLSVDGSERYQAADLPTISAGTGAPTEALPDASIYLREDAAGLDDFLYCRIGGAWLAATLS